MQRLGQLGSLCLKSHGRPPPLKHLCTRTLRVPRTFRPLIPSDLLPVSITLLFPTLRIHLRVLRPAGGLQPRVRLNRSLRLSLGLQRAARASERLPVLGAGSGLVCRGRPKPHSRSNRSLSQQPQRHRRLSVVRHSRVRARGPGFRLNHSARSLRAHRRSLRSLPLNPPPISHRLRPPSVPNLAGPLLHSWPCCPRCRAALLGPRAVAKPLPFSFSTRSPLPRPRSLFISRLVLAGRSYVTRGSHNFIRG